MSGIAVLGIAMVIGFGLSAPKAEAAYIVTLTQQGSDVVATGSGTINLAGLSFFNHIAPVNPIGIHPSSAIIITGAPTNQILVDVYTGFTGPTSFGSGPDTTADSGSGDRVSLLRSFDQLAVPAGYVSGNPLADSATYNNATFQSLGVTPGVYVYTFGQGASADSFTVDIVATPEPASALLLALPLGLATLSATRRRRATRDA